MKVLLKTAREKKGLKINDISRLLKIDQALISKFESGQRRPTKDQAIKLANLLDIDPETILVLWLKEKILHEIANEEFALKALEAAEQELNPVAKPNLKEASDSLQKLLLEMDALKNKFDALK